MRTQPVPLYGLWTLQTIVVGNYRGKIGEIIEIIIKGDGVTYGIASIPGTFNKTLYYKEEELLDRRMCGKLEA
jgi:hypothetical protein